MRQMMGFFQVSEHRQDREIPWSQSQIADYGEWWCSDLQDLVAKPTLWWSIHVDSLFCARKHSWCTTHVRWPKRWEEKQRWTALFAKESLMCKTWSFATCALARCNCDWSLGSYRSTTDQLQIWLLPCHHWQKPPGGFSCSKEEELARLQYRLGMAYFFPFFQPENAKFQLVAGWKCSWNILKCSGRW